MPVELFATIAVAVGLIWATWLLIRDVDQVDPLGRPAAIPVERHREEGGGQ